MLYYIKARRGAARRGAAWRGAAIPSHRRVGIITTPTGGIRTTPYVGIGIGIALFEPLVGIGGGIGIAL